jgi:hypothetical protein
MGPARFELATNALKGHCSTVELKTRILEEVMCSLVGD